MTTAGRKTDPTRTPIATPSRKKRVLIYAMNYAPEPTGVGRFTGELGSFLAHQGINVDVITSVPHYPGWSPRNGYSNAYTSESLDGVRVIRCPLVLKTQMRGIWRLIAPLTFALSSAPIAFWRIIRMGYDIVICVEPTLLIAPTVLAASRITNTPTMLHVQDLEVDAAFAVGHLRNNRLRGAALKFERFIVRIFDSVVTISNRMRDKLHEKGVSEGRVLVIRNWVDLTKIKPLENTSRIRAELQIPTDVYVALYAGNIGAKQSLHLALQAAEALSEEHNILFVISGEGPERQALEEQFGALPNVRFFGLQPEDRLCELLNMADVHILPQEADVADLVLPSKLGGMLASGKPCIVMADAGTELHDVLGDVIAVVPCGDVAALGRKIVEFSRREKDTGQERRIQLARHFSSDSNLKTFMGEILRRSRAMPEFDAGITADAAQDKATS